MENHSHSFLESHRYFGPRVWSKNGLRLLAAEALQRLSLKLRPKDALPRCVESFSQSGEDLYLDSVFSNLGINQGFYVDVGAMHPYLFSNTARFAALGWKGVCIEPQPELARLHRTYRKYATVVESAVAPF